MLRPWDAGRFFRWNAFGGPPLGGVITMMIGASHAGGSSIGNAGGAAIAALPIVLLFSYLFGLIPAIAHAIFVSWVAESTRRVWLINVASCVFGGIGSLSVAFLMSLGEKGQSENSVLFFGFFVVGAFTGGILTFLFNMTRVIEDDVAKADLQGPVQGE